MKINRSVMIGAFVLAGAGVTGLGAISAIAAGTTDDVATEEAHQHETMAAMQPAAAQEPADDTAMDEHQHEMMTDMKSESDTATAAATDAATAAATDTATDAATDADAAAMHAHHHDMTAGTMRSTVDYTLPAVTLIRDDGKAVSLVDELNDGRPVVLTFIYTTCTTICPMISQTFEELQGKLDSERDRIHMVSISIDPEEDTPARLRAYAARFDAGPEWQYYTGTVEASIAAQRAFNVYRGDKMNHTAVAFFRAAPGKPWLRIDGLATPAELLNAYHEVVASN